MEGVCTLPLVPMLFVHVCLYFFPVSLLAVSTVNFFESTPHQSINQHPLLSHSHQYKGENAQMLVSLAPYPFLPPVSFFSSSS